MIWSTVSSGSCFCWLYRASPSLAAKNIINLISVLTIWWCPCVLGIIYYIHYAWKPQPSGRLERANHFLKSVIKKITQEPSLGWKEALPIAFLCTRISPKEQVSFSPYEMLYWSPFVYVSDLFLDPEAQTFWSHTMAIVQFQKDICLWGINKDPQVYKEPPLYFPGDQVIIKVWKDRSPKARLQPMWKGPYPVILLRG